MQQDEYFLNKRMNHTGTFSKTKLDKYTNQFQNDEKRITIMSLKKISNQSKPERLVNFLKHHQKDNIVKKKIFEKNELPKMEGG